MYVSLLSPFCVRMIVVLFERVLPIADLAQHA